MEEFGENSNLEIRQFKFNCKFRNSVKLFNVQSQIFQDLERSRKNFQYKKCSPNIPLQFLCLHKLKSCAKIERKVKLQMCENMSLTEILVSEINHKFQSLINP